MRVHQQAQRKVLRATDVRLIYEASFVTIVAQFELLLEELFVEMLCGAAPIRRPKCRLVQPRNRAVFRAIYKQNKQYASFLPYQNVKGLAKSYLHEGRPFTLVPDSDVELLLQAVRVRNAIAHRGPKATTEFRKMVPGVDSLPPSHRFPGPFLMSEFRANPVQKRIQLYVTAFLRVGRQLLDGW